MKSVPAWLGQAGTDGGDGPWEGLPAEDFVDKAEKFLFFVRQLQSVDAVAKDIVAKAVSSV